MLDIDLLLASVRLRAEVMLKFVCDSAEILREVDLASLEKHVVELLKWDIGPVLEVFFELLHNAPLDELLVVEMNVFAFQEFTADLLC